MRRKGGGAVDYLIAAVIVVPVAVGVCAGAVIHIIRADRARERREAYLLEKAESVDRQAEWRQAARRAEYPDATSTLSATGGWFIAADDFEPSPGQYPAFDPRDLLPPEVPGAD